MGSSSFVRRVAVILCLAVVMAAEIARAEPVVVEGRAEVIDGATIEIWGQRIRLAGITVPDARSKDGQAGKRFLQDLLADLHVRCLVEEPTFPIGLSARCVAGNVDIAERLVQMGYARSARR
jgi:endonuclease YncB( thermonuclease family)